MGEPVEKVMNNPPARPALTMPEALRLAHQHHVAGRLAEAEHIYRLILKAQPKHVDALHLLGLLCHQRGDNATAVMLMQQAVALLPAFAEAHNNLGIAFQGQGKLDDAIGCFRRAVALKPEYHEAHNNLAIALRHQGKLEEAIDSARRAAAIKPDYHEAHLNLADALQAKGRLDEAIACYRHVIALAPGCFEAHNNLGVALAGLGRSDMAIGSYQHAIEVEPNYHAAYNNLGLALQSQGKLREAEDRYRSALRVKSDYPDAHANLSMLLLLEGRFEEGWAEFERRGTVRAWQNRPRDFVQPIWRGEDIEGRTLLISAEFGFGDTIQFCRYIPLLAARARVILEVQRPLVRLVSGLPGAAQVIAYGDPLPPYDYYCPLMSLPRVFGTTLESIPAGIPYLSADPVRVAHWRERLADLSGLRVGLAWAGNPNLPRDRQRSIPLDRLADLADVKGVAFVSLQKVDGALQTRSFGPGAILHDWTDELVDFAETAALIENLDLVISVDTSIVHLAGALGRPVWLLNRFDTCWRWLLDRDDSPWYPTLRQFRQPQRDDWSSVLKDVQAQLERRVAESRRLGPPQRQ